MTATTASQHLPAGSAASGPYALEVTPESAGWGHSSLRVLELPAGGSHTLDTGADEVLVVPLSGGLVVECDGEVLTCSDAASPAPTRAGTRSCSSGAARTSAADSCSTTAPRRCRMLRNSSSSAVTLTPMDP